MTDRDEEITKLQDENIDTFMKHGPRLSTKMNAWIVGKDTVCGAIVKGGFGGMGVGKMWGPMTDEHRNDPRFDEVPEIECDDELYRDGTRDSLSDWLKSRMKEDPEDPFLKSRKEQMDKTFFISRDPEADLVALAEFQATQWSGYAEHLRVLQDCTSKRRAFSATVIAKSLPIQISFPKTFAETFLLRHGNLVDESIDIWENE